MIFQKFRVRQEVSIFFMIFSFSVGIIFLAAPAAATDVFSLIDVNGVETNNISDLYMTYYRIQSSSVFLSFYESDSSHHFTVREGEVSQSFSFSEINEIDFSWSDTESRVVVSTKTGKKISGVPVSTDSWTLRGRTEYGSVRLGVRQTKRITRNDGIAISSSGLVQTTASPGKEMFNFYNTEGGKIRDITDLRLSYYKITSQSSFMQVYDSDTSNEFTVKRGETFHSIPFTNINAIIYSWSDTNENTQAVVATVTGKKISGQPDQVSYWKFKGVRNSEPITLEVRNISQVFRKGISGESLPEGIMLPDSEGGLGMLELFQDGGKTFQKFISFQNVYNQFRESVSSFRINQIQQFYRHRYQFF